MTGHTACHLTSTFTYSSNKTSNVLTIYIFYNHLNNSVCKMTKRNRAPLGVQTSSRDEINKQCAHLKWDYSLLIIRGTTCANQCGADQSASSSSDWAPLGMSRVQMTSILYQSIRTSIQLTLHERQGKVPDAATMWMLLYSMTFVLIRCLII